MNNRFMTVLLRYAKRITHPHFGMSWLQKRALSASCMLLMTERNGKVGVRACSAYIVISIFLISDRAMCVSCEGRHKSGKPFVCLLRDFMTVI